VSELLPVVAVILLSGIGAHLLADRLRVPSVVFFLAIGIALGNVAPETVLGPIPGVSGAEAPLVTQETFGEGLEALVGLSVAIIVFDGAFDLRAERVREASTASLRLVTVGAVVMFLGTAAAVQVLLEPGWGIALVVGALLVATGPTVITPILEVVRVREHVGAALETEGIVNDVTAAIAAVVIFEVLLVGEGGLAAGAVDFLRRFGTGVAAGLLGTVLVYWLLRYEATERSGPRAARFLLLTAAVGSFVAAEVVAAEAGIAAAATAGVALGNLEVPHREEMEEFGRDLTLVVLGFVFVSLAALIDLGAIRSLGVEAVVLAAVVMLVLRPLVALIATAGVERFTRPERLFLGAVGPRGIIPASVATLFAIELELAGDEAGAQALLGAVFVVILITVAVEAGPARQIGDALDVTPMRTIIVGGGRVGQALAQRLDDPGEFVVVVESDPEQCATIREAGFTVVEGDGTETADLREAGAGEGKLLVAATGDDDVNLLACQLARTKFDIQRLYARVNSPENIDAFESQSVVAIDSPMATAQALDNEIERPALSRWMNDLGDTHSVRQTTVTAERIAGQSVKDLNDEIPGGCLIAEIGDGDDAHVPDADEVIELGDSVTFIGDTTAVETAVKRFHPHD